MKELSSATKPIIFDIKRTVLVPGVCPCICIRSMMHYVHTGEVVDIFWLVTTRPIAHTGQFICIRNCVGEFATDTGQPLVTRNVMSNHLIYHHKAYYNNNNNIFFNVRESIGGNTLSKFLSYLMGEGHVNLIF